MPLDAINSLLPAAGSLALLLNPTPEFSPPYEGITAAPIAVTADAEAEAGAEHLLGDWGGTRSQWAKNGFAFTVQYIGEVEGNVSGGIKRGAVYNGLLVASLDGDLEKLAGWPGATLHAGMLFPHGRSLSGNYVGDLFVLSNLDATDEPHLFELWLQQNFADDTLSLRLGQIAADQEFAFTERGALFGNSAFGWFPIAGANVPAPVYPQGAPGVRLAWHPKPNCYAQAAVFDGNVNPSDAAGNETNPNGVNFQLDEGALVLVETGHNWDQFFAGDKRRGFMKLGGWYHTATFAHERIDDSGLSLADPLSSGRARQLRGNWGIYFVGEQTLWNEPSDRKDSAQGAGFFTRLGYAPSDRNTLEVYGELGVAYTGLLPARDEDVCGLAIACGEISGELRQLVRDENLFNGTSHPIPDQEIAMELSYQFRVRAGWKLQPGLKYIVHPGGSADTDNALIVGLRSTFDF